MDTGKQLNANELIAKLQELEKENARLRKILDVHGIPYIVTEPNVTTKESLQAIFFPEMQTEKFLDRVFQKTGNENLIEEYDMQPFEVNVLDRRRTLTEK